jgi:hypothetical protein
MCVCLHMCRHALCPISFSAPCNNNNHFVRTFR